MKTTARTQHADTKSALPDRYLTPDDIAAIFGVPLETVYQWRKKRTGPPGFRIGKHLRYDPADLHTYVTQQKNGDQLTA